MVKGYLFKMYQWYLLTIISSISANHIGTSTLPSLSIIKSGNSYYCTITNDNSSSALLWNYQNIDKTPSSNVYCNVDENNRCTIENLGTWQWINDKNVSPILDYRWESFDAVQLIENLQKVYETNEKNFRLSFSVKIKEVHIILCESDILNHPKNGNCYWISLGANSGKKNYIRKCDASAVHLNARDFPTDENCVVRQVEFIGEIINETQWHHFTVSKQENTITVWKYGRSESILNYTDGSQEVFTTKYVFARRSFSNNAYFMKIHEVKILSINESSAAVTIQLTDRYTVETNCLALYVKSCKGCSFNVNLSSKYKVLKQMTIKSLGDDWQEVILQDENNFTEAKEISLRTDSEIQDNTEKPYWHISNTIRKCGSTDFAMKKGDEGGCCYALKYPDQQICTARIKDTPNEGDWTCPANTIGKSCIPCTSIPGEQKCEYSKICEWTSNGDVCSCAPGYLDIDCQSVCPSGRYGLNCRMECDRCAVTCNNINGTCSSCARNFEGDTCQTAILPLLKNAPKISKTGHTSVTILANMEYEGTQEPYLYEISLYQENDGIWIRHGQLMSYSKSRQSYVVNGLKLSTKYKIKIILQTSNGLKYDGNFVPETDFETTCADITEDILQNKVTNTSITLTVDVNKPRYRETCLISSHRLSVYEIGGVYSVHNSKLEIENSIEPLKPYTNYRIEIRKNNAIILNTTLQTKQGVPDQVQNIVHVTTNTTVTIKWNSPLFKNGYITEYRIQYQHLRYRMCDTKDYSKSPAIIISKINTTAIVSNLLPFSNYLFKIWAVTEYDGKPKDFSVQTEETSSPSKDEFPDLSFIDSNKKLIVIMTWNCEKLKGPLRFKAELTCRSKWCSHRTQNDYGGNLSKDGGNSKPKMQFQTTGKTEYVLKFFISRNNHEIFSLTPLTTGPSVPGFVRNVTVYSKNSTSTSIRWLPPHPPEGDVESYWVSYWVGYGRGSVEIKIEKTAFCKLWSEYICVTITGLEEHSWYYFQIGAKNMDVSEKGRAVKAPAYTQEEAPEPPQNMGLQWDNQYGLIVRWQHPDKTNGVLRDFLLYINDENMASYPVTEENPQYQYKMNILKELTLQELKIGITARNSAGNSPIITNSIFSPPKTPKFTGVPNIDDIKNTSFRINIPEISNIEGNISTMYIIVTNTQNNVMESHNSEEHKLFKKIGLELDNSWIVGEFDLTGSKNGAGFPFNVGNETETASNVASTRKLNNRKLDTGTAYNISIILNNTFRDLVRYRVYRLNCTVLQSENGGGSYLLVLLLIPLLLLCIGGVLYMKRKNINMNPTVYFNLQQLGLSRNTNEAPLRPLIVPSNDTPQPTPLPKPQISVTKKVEVPIEIELKYSKPVKISDLDAYIKKSIEDGEFEKQHGLFARGQTKPWTYGTKPQNKTKNRYMNLAAYDETRVKLNIINGDPCSDYINANYIDGYKSKKAYIATQGPKSSTLNDFWRMIWQEKVECVIMIANIIEAGKRKVERYWPEINSSREFDKIKVKYINVEVMANYEVRYFNVSCDNEERKIQQMHFLTWPDHGVPLYAQSLAPFLRKMLTIPQGRAPILVHCSAGVGRTGSLILCDICLRMAAREGKIDALYYLHQIREQRVNMVDNVEQYKLVHLVLLQCLVAPETGILCDATMEKNIETIIARKIKEEMNYLEDSAWQDEAMRNSSIDSDLPIIHVKNRFKNILPDAAVRICLSPYPSDDETSTYINAITVDAFLTPSKFIVTQDPMSKTVGDYWRLVDEKEITMIVCLNKLDFQDKTTCKFYPTTVGQSMKPVPYLEITCTGREDNTHYKVFSICMSILNQKTDDIDIKIIHLKNWTFDMLHPENPTGILMAYEEMNRLGRTSDTILITCHDGARASGLYTAMCFLIDKIKLEQVCDVCLAVRTVRHSRKEFVRQQEQFSFLYKCALEYVRQFEMYSNFSAMKTSN